MVLSLGFATDTLRVLIVEDRPIMLKILRKLLASGGFRDIDEAINGRFALERLATKRYDLILSDWNMDDLSGFELLKAVRANPETATTPFILVTAEAKPDNIAAAQRAGVNGYLLKPFGADALTQAIQSALKRTPTPVAALA
jgi:two-component system chemotaxis response regulator CheY